MKLTERKLQYPLQALIPDLLAKKSEDHILLWTANMHVHKGLNMMGAGNALPIAKAFPHIPVEFGRWLTSRGYQEPGSSIMVGYDRQWWVFAAPAKSLLVSAFPTKPSYVVGGNPHNLMPQYRSKYQHQLAPGWMGISQPEIIYRSANNLATFLVNHKSYTAWIPWLPGCGKGALERDAVSAILQPILEPYLNRIHFFHP